MILLVFKTSARQPRAAEGRFDSDTLPPLTSVSLRNNCSWLGNLNPHFFPRDLLPAHSRSMLKVPSTFSWLPEATMLDVYHHLSHECSWFRFSNLGGKPQISGR